MRVSVSVLLLVLLSFPAHSQWVPLGASGGTGTTPLVTLIDDGPDGTTFRVEVPGFETVGVPAGGMSYRSIDLGTESRANVTGEPAIPYVPVVLAVPDRGEITVEVVDLARPVAFQGYRFPPARPSWKEGDPEPNYVENERAYRSAAPFPAQRAVLDQPVVFRDFRLARIAVHPVQYTPSTGEVEIAPSVTIRVRYGPGSGVNAKTSPRRAIAPSFARLYRSTILNYGSMLEREYGGMELGRDVLLIITPDSFATSLQPYVQWKHRSGVFTVMKTFNEIGANSSNPSLIRNYVLGAYNTWAEPPTHVLLVGDYGVVPVSLISYDYTFANEDYFVELEGNDFFPEMMIGRFTNQGDYRLRVMTNKFLKYEQTPYTADPTWFRKGIVCSNNAYESQITTKRFTADVMMTDGGFLSVDTMMSSTPCVYGVSNVIAAVTNGRGFLNYRGEGWTSGWAASCLPFHTSDVTSINNGQKFTFVTSIGCGVAMFNDGGGNSFGEEWVEMGTLTAPRGAVAFVGPTSNTHTTYNNKIDKGIYVGMFREGMETPGEALLRGKLYMYNVHGNTQSVEYHYRVYTVLGDPTIHIWKNTPAPAAVSAPTQLSVGYNQVQVVVRDSATAAPRAGVTVCLSGNGVFALGVSDGAGVALLEVTPTTTDPLTLVARGNTVIPAVRSIPVVPAQVYVAPQGTPVVTDLDGNMDGRVNPNERCRLTYTLKNWGTQTAPGVLASVTSADTALARVITSSPLSFGNIPANGTSSGDPFEILVAPSCPVGTVLSLTLHVTSGSSSWDYHLTLNVQGCLLNVAGYLVNDQGSALANGRLDPGETAVLYFTLANQGQDRAPGVTGRLRSSDNRIIIVDSVGTFGAIDTASEGTNLVDPFVVTVSDTCSRNTSIPLILQISTGGGFYPYTTTGSLSLPVGTPMPTDPTGPDGYGYYAYTSDDSAFEQSPAYSWVEIDGLGTVVPGNSNGDYTVTVSLPFPVRYYGTDYSSLRISSDGWIAFGSGTQVAYQNYPLPHNDAVAAMIAPFWDDLFHNTSQEIGQVLYYHDAAGHRFIIEWLNVGHWGNPTDRETFQVILLDPAHHPTNTGNGDILFQYKTVTEPGSVTVGIENPQQNGALQYVFDEAYDATATPLRDHLAIRFTTEPPSTGAASVQVSVPIQAGWNLISNPVVRPDPLNTVLSLYPHSAFEYVFGFQPGAGYAQHTVMVPGEGYWSKFPAGETNVIGGGRISLDSIAVHQGWNIIGSISTFVDTARIVALPPGIRSSVFFGYSGGYYGSAFLAPGEAYWVKASAPGVFILAAGAGPATAAGTPATDPLASLHRLTVADAAGMGQTLFFGPSAGEAFPRALYAMPPLPPEGVFDARIASADGGTLAAAHSAGESAEFPLAIRSAAYPLTISWELKDGEVYELTGRVGDAQVRLAEVHRTGRTVIGRPDIQGLALRLVVPNDVPREFVLEQNYPNPFNPVTSIRFGLPAQSTVTAEVFNVLGQRVMVLLREERKAGYHTIVWDGHGDDGRQLGSGTYFLHLEAKGESGGSFSATRKLLLIK